MSILSVPANPPELHLSKRAKNEGWEHIPRRTLLNVKLPSLTAQERTALSTPGALGTRIKLITDFANACMLSLETVEMIYEPLYVRALEVVWQYHTYITTPYAKQFSALVNSTAIDLMLTAVAKLEDILASRLPHRSRKVDGWHAQTVFEVVFAALAARAGPGGDLYQSGSAWHGKIREWQKASNAFLPSCVCLSLSYKILGASLPRWDGWKELETFERTLRTARIIPKVRILLGRAREMLEEVRTTEETTVKGKERNNSLVRRGTEKLAGLLYGMFGSSVSWGVWRAVDGKTLQEKDQCPTCRALWSGVELFRANGEIQQELGSNWSKEDPCQCAETDLASQIVSLLLLTECSELARE